MRFLINITYGLLALTLVNCAPAPDNTESEEQFCSEASGSWTVSTVTCNGTAATLPPITMTFDNAAGTVTQTYGNADCEAGLTWNSQQAAGSSLLTLTGTGNMSCSQVGNSVSSCTEGSLSCADSQSITGIDNSFSQCAITGSNSMSMTRVISAQNASDGYVFCAEGETEVLTLAPTTSVAVLALSDGPSYDYGTVQSGSSGQKSLTITNLGTADATALEETGLVAPFGFLGGGFPGTGGDCTTTLVASDSCTIMIEFAPSAAGAFTDTITMSYNDGAANQMATRDIQGTGTGGSSAVLVIAEAPLYDYGSVTMGATNAYTFTVTNAGGGTATAISNSGLATPFMYSGGTYPGTGGTCVSTLVAAGSCDIVIEFSPVFSGLSGDTIELNYNDGVAAQIATRDIQGTGVQPALLFISNGPTFDFGSLSIGNDGDQSFLVANTGGTSASSIAEIGLALPFSFLGGSYPGLGGTCALTLAPGTNCTIVIRFSPTAVTGYSDTIELAYSDGVSAQLATRPVTGTGVP